MNRRRYFNNDSNSGGYLLHKNYLRFTALEDCEFYFNITEGSVLFSTDEGKHWEGFYTLSPVSVSAGNSIIWKQSVENIPTNGTSLGNFSSTGAFNISGCIASLIDGDGDFESIETVPYDNLFSSLFASTPVVDVNDLILISNPSNWCYNNMFQNCTNLTNMPIFDISNTAIGCYCSMFDGCINLAQNVNIYCDEEAIARSCYDSMFRDCESITNVIISCSIAGERSFMDMFRNCTSLQTAQVTINSVASYCCQSMFEGCTSLTNVTPLVAETLVEGCYLGMFYGCTSLTVSPIIKAKHLPSANKSVCCRDMFKDCSSLSTIYCFAEDNIDTDNFFNWVDGVAATGTFCKPNSVIWPTGVNGIPTNWVINSNIFSYLTFTALEDTTFTFTQKTLQYSLDDGVTWTTLAANTASPTVTAGNKILWKQTGLTPSSYIGIGTFSATGNFDASGNIMSLYYGDNFVGQTSLSESYAFYKLFNGNTKLVSVENLILPATTLVSYCYQYMFQDCTSLITTPELPAITLATSCYHSMFYGCTSLTTPPNLPATTLAQVCYYYMFSGCKALTKVPELPVTTLATNCYAGMFSRCTSLTTAPNLPATTLAQSCYESMFNGCTSLNYIKCLATNISTINCTKNWVNNVSSTGIFVKSPNMNNWTLGNNGIPNGWEVYDNDNSVELYLFSRNLEIADNSNVNNYELPTLYNPHNLPVTYSSSDPSIISVNSLTGELTLNLYGNVEISIIFSGNEDYSAKTLSYSVSYSEINYKLQYFTIKSLEDNNNIILKSGTSSASKTIYWSSDLETWNSTTVNNAGTTITTLNLGEKIYLKGNKIVYFNSSANSEVEGNIMSLLYEDNFLSTNTLPEWAFSNIFEKFYKLISAENLILPSANLSEYCFSSMFLDCKALIKAPKLKATILNNRCYAYMFENCIALTTAPELPATTLAEYCYRDMFRGCTSLISAPELPATTLADSCYRGIFYGCTALTTAPELPATTLASSCYSEMFLGCTALINAPELPVITLASDCYSWMFLNCTSLVYPPELPATNLAWACYRNMFYNCTSLTIAPNLPATTLANSCYFCMFQGCTSLILAPVLPALTLRDNCYDSMFNGCTSLNYIKCLATGKYTSPSVTVTRSWLSNTSPIGTFVKDSNMEFVYGANGIPILWCVYNNGEAKLSLNKLLCTIFSDLNSYLLPILSNPENLEVTYESSDPNIISINNTTGEITLHNYGSVVISIIFNGNNDYAAKTLTYTINYLESYETAPYEYKYLTIISLEDNNTIGWCSPTNIYRTIDISIDNGVTWESKTSTTSGITLAVLNLGNKLLIKGNNSFYGESSKENSFTSTGLFKVEGNVLSLIYEGNLYNNYNNYKLGSDYTFRRLFASSKVVNAENLILPIFLSSNCYNNMFRECTSLTTPPVLPATTLAERCYGSMFYGCTSLTTAPELPATILANNCYQYMFDSCTSLTTAPELPATALTQYCYQYMFNGCTSLETAPELPATTLATYCYYQMFYGCTSLNYIKCLATNISANNSRTNWVQNVAATGTFVKADNVLSWTFGQHGIPSGWTVINASEET